MGATSWSTFKGTLQLLHAWNILSQQLQSTHKGTLKLLLEKSTLRVPSKLPQLWRNVDAVVEGWLGHRFGHLISGSIWLCNRFYFKWGNFVKTKIRFGWQCVTAAWAANLYRIKECSIGMCTFITCALSALVSAKFQYGHSMNRVY